MSKLLPGFCAILLAGSPAGAAVLGPHAGLCAGGHPAMLVRIIGLKARRGIVRVQSYGGNPAGFLDKGTYLERVEVQPPATGPVEVCMPVPAPGTYAVMVRHFINGRQTSDWDQGGGISGNPNRSVLDAMLKRKPAPEQMSVRVAEVVTVPIVLNYLQGGSLKPLATER